MTLTKKWSIILSRNAEKSFAKLDYSIQRTIQQFFIQRLQCCDNPRSTGKALTGTMKGLWRYRIGDYRVLCHIDDNALVIVAVELGHRRDIYE